MSVPTEAKADQKLIRALGVPGLAANIVNFTVGASIFVLPALIATTLGAASPLAYIVCAIAMCLFAGGFHKSLYTRIASEVACHVVTGFRAIHAELTG